MLPDPQLGVRGLSDSPEVLLLWITGDAGNPKERTATKAKDYRVNVEHEVQAHPLKSMAYAFGAGAVVGLLLGRNRR